MSHSCPAAVYPAPSIYDMARRFRILSYLPNVSVFVFARPSNQLRNAWPPAQPNPAPCTFGTAQSITLSGNVFSLARSCNDRQHQLLRRRYMTPDFLLML